MSPRKPGNARIKILEAASELFYGQGYQATTVDQVIIRSGISKPTVYSYFSTKEDLCLSYLEEMSSEEILLLKEALRREATPETRFLAIISHVRSRIIAAGFRGCGFYNMISEIHDEESPMVMQARKHIDKLRRIIRKVVEELLETKGNTIEVDEVADAYYLLIAGAIAACQEFRASWPADRAVNEAGYLLKRA